jgi:hypothetical protein
MPDLVFSVRGSGFEVQDSGFEVQDSGFGVHILESRNHASRIRDWGLKFMLGVWRRV